MKRQIPNDEIQWNIWNGGTNTLLSDQRISPNQSGESRNVWLVEDGLWQTRPGTAKYTGDLGDTCDGWTQYTKSNGTRELIAVADGKIYKMAGTSWAQISGGTGLTPDNECHFAQLRNYLYIANGVDALRRYDGSTVTTYTEIAAPTSLGSSLTGLAAGSNNYYYQVTASNEVGETTPCTELKVSVNRARDNWTTGDGVILTWTKPAGTITRYTIYTSPYSGYEGRLADVDGTLTTYTDNKSATPNQYVSPPFANTTTAPRFTQMVVSGGRIWATGDPSNPDVVYFSGSGVNAGAFNWHNDGGWIALNRGAGDSNTSIVEFQGKVHVFKSWSIWDITLLYNSTYMCSIPTATKIISGIGCVAPLSVVKADNDVFFFHNRGFFVLGNEPNVVSTVLRTSEISAVIRPYIQGMTQANKSKVCGFYKDGKIFYSVSYGTTGIDNNRMIIYDRERACWIADWTVGYRRLGEFEDEDNVRRLLGSSGEGFIDEISENYQGDRGVAFSQKVSTNQVTFKTWTDFAMVRKAFVSLRNPRGSIGFEVLGDQKSKTYASLKTATIVPTAAATGIGWDLVGDFNVGDTEGSPGSFEDQDVIRFINVNKRVRSVQLAISASGLDSYFTLLGMKVKLLPLKTQPPSGWKLSS